MKQRLAIAAALLKSPDLLILDEPTNGLDPAGIRGIRDLIRDLGESGVTVLLSSHILAEVQQVCHSVSIVGEGRLLARGRVEDLLGENVSRTRVGVTDPQGARHFLEAAGYTVTRQGDRLVVEGHEQPGADHQAAGRARASTSASSPRSAPTLESFFLKLTGRPQPTDRRRPTTRDRRGLDRRGGLLMRLLAVELNRFRSRRAIALLMLAAAVLAVVLAGVTAWNTRPLSHGRPHRRRCAGRPRGQEARDPAGGPGLPRRPRGLPRSLGHRRRVRGRAGPGPRGLLPARPAQHGHRAVHRGSVSRSRSSWSA